MKTTVKKLSDTKVQLTISLGASELADAEQVSLTKLARDIKVPGFRKGKVPASIAAKHVDPNALQEQILENALSKAVAEAFLQEKLQALDRPSVEVKKFVPGSELEFTAEVEVIPPVKLGDYKKLIAKKEAAKVEDKDVDEVIERIRKNYSEKSEVKRAAKLFEEGVIGHKAGEEFDLKLKFPEDYHADNLAGQDVVFTVKLHKVNELKLPELNDEFAAKCGPFTEMKEVKEDIKRELTAQKEREADEKFKDALVGELTEKSKAALPELLVEDQLRSIERDLTQNLMYSGLSLDSYLKTQGFKDKEEWVKKEARPAAEKRVKAGLVLAELSKELKIDASRDEIQKQIDFFKQQYGKDKKMLEQFDNPNVHRDIANRMITDKTVTKLVELNTKK